MKALTARQQAMWDMKQAERSNQEIADALGISINNVGKTLTIIRGKLGQKNKPGSHSRLQVSPEVAAAAIDAAADPLSPTQKEAIERVNKELQAAGMPGKVSEAVVRRMLVRYAGVVTVKKQLTTQELLKTIDEELSLVSSYIDDKVVAEASLRDLGMFKAALIEKRQLLRGEPTAILSDHDRKSVQELLPALMAEAKRRSITVEGQVTSVEVSPG